MNPVLEVATPSVTFLMMVVVGHSLTGTDLRRSATDLRALVTGTIGQLILLPLIATITVLVFEPSPATIAGLILVAACPGGTISNFYACLAHANTALSVTLTAISCLLSLITIPVLVTAGFYFWLDRQPDVEVPFVILIVQLLALVALPVVLGMVLRRWRPENTTSRDLVLRRLSLGALVALVVAIVHDQYAVVVAALGELSLVSVVFTVLAMVTGLGLAWVTGRSAADRLTYVIEFPCRNLALALTIAITTLGRPEFVGFAAVLLLVQAIVMLGMIVLLRRTPDAL
jgi:BASS family bile acid:Na+ symporter